MKSAKTKFVTAHLMISFGVALVAVLVVFLCWYPAPLNKATGVTHIFLMMLGIDLILGPALTWLVYKEGKKSLKFDLTVIILIQISALCYGLYHIAQGRPAWIVYSVDRFDLIKNNEVYTKNIQQATKEFQQPSWLKPEYAAIQFAVDRKQKNQDMFDEILGGLTISQRPERYIALAKVKQQIQKRVQSLDVLNQFNDKALVQNILSKYPQATAFVPLKANAVDMTVLINKEKGEVVKIVDLRPWK
ncbi:hypothetical protein F909_00589 [Acinetobacter sp. ANC 3929]|uniref:TfpX/TfpZ family type IV pilin accessory protein n=1 Tax=unclassified Acinetobacter TaxID=196816 RepID=UPI0002CF8196|nr:MULTISPECIES: TfpX/TfpZ family type IV pilin accessory protein [unclassified Acinetobacter]ENW83578.1 hypothetical protein F909_00589 [Acinetobacter sp. ANC 3929]MCH7350744.1 type IV pilin accessory protein [Acinetobacter sp. NIPH 2023]MCH7354768.1 type IV pilin accessory protein [Acinetobacter sp. NIPH 1958]MCH7358462.1 type IV pilin accessory protein [Acinetobacter sp. NIPH 2024]